MVKSKILYDHVTFLGGSYRTKLINPFNNTISDDLQNSNYNELHSHYFLIINRNKKMINRIKQRVITSLEPIAEQETLGEGKNCELWRISSPVNTSLNQKQVYRGIWERNPTLHEKKSEAIENLVKEADFKK